MDALIKVLILILSLFLMFFPLLPIKTKRKKFNTIATLKYEKPHFRANAAFIVLSIVEIIVFAFAAKGISMLGDLIAAIPIVGTFLADVIAQVDPTIGYIAFVVTVLLSNLLIVYAYAFLKAVLKAILNSFVYTGEEKRDRKEKKKAKKKERESEKKSANYDIVLPMEGEEPAEKPLVTDNIPVLKHLRIDEKNEEKKTRAKTAKRARQKTQSVAEENDEKRKPSLFAALFFEDPDYLYAKPWVRRMEIILQYFVYVTEVFFLLFFTALFLSALFPASDGIYNFFLNTLHVQNWYYYPFLSLILLQEICNTFHTDLRPAETKEQEKTEEELAEENRVALRDLAAELKRYFDRDHKLRFYPGDIIKPNEFEYRFTNSQYMAALEYIRRKFANKSGGGQSYLECMDALYNDEHVYFCGSFYSQIGEYIIAYTYTRLLSGARLVFIVNDSHKRDTVRRYIQSRLVEMTGGSAEITWRVYTSEDRLDQADILVASPEDFKDDNIVENFPDFFEEVCNAIFIDADKVVSLESYLCPVLAIRLLNATSDRIRFLFLSTDLLRGFAASSLPKLFCVDKVLSFSSANDNESVEYTLWNRESLKNRIYYKYGQKLMSLEGIIAEKAYNYGVDGIRVVTASPIDHGEREVLEGHGVEINEFFKDVPKINYMIYTDERCNLAAAIYACTRFKGQRYSVSQIISKPYLLRDYFMAKATRENFIKRSSYIQPRITEHAKREKLSLLKIFCRASAESGISVSQFINEMKDVIALSAIRGDAPLCKYCADPRYRTQTNTLTEYDYAAYLIAALCDDPNTDIKDSHAYKAKDYYLVFDRINHEMYSLTKDKFITFGKVREVLEKVFSCNDRVTLRLNDRMIGSLDTFSTRLPLEYVIGQSIVYNNVEYEIEQISADNKIVFLRRENVTYKNCLDTLFLRRYKIYYSEKIGQDGAVYNSGSLLKEIRVSLQRVGMEGETYGFYNLMSNNQSLNFKRGVEGNPHLEREIVDRNRRMFSDGRMLRVSLNTGMECTDGMRMLLSAVFNEFIKTMFPMAYRCIAILPVLREPISPEESEIEDADVRAVENIKRLYPYQIDPGDRFFDVVTRIYEAATGECVLPEKEEIPEEEPHAEEFSEETIDVPSEAEETADVPSEAEETADVPSEVEETADVLSEVEETADVPSEVEETADVPSEVEETADVPSKVEETTDVLLEVEETADVPSEIEETADVPSEVEESAELPDVETEEPNLKNEESDTSAEEEAFDLCAFLAENSECRETIEKFYPDFTEENEAVDARLDEFYPMLLPADRKFVKKVVALYPKIAAAKADFRETDAQRMQFLFLNDCSEDVGVFDWFYDKLASNVQELLINVYSYLYWLNVRRDLDHYIYFGLDALPSCYDLEGACKLLADYNIIISDNGEKNYETASDGDDVEMRRCSFCHRRMESGRYSFFDEGQTMYVCADCMDLVGKGNRLHEIDNEVRKYLEDSYPEIGFGHAEVEFADENEPLKNLGEWYFRIDPDSRKIYVGFDLPERNAKIAILLGMIAFWQYDNDLMTEFSGAQLSYEEMKYLRQFGDPETIEWLSENMSEERRSKLNAIQERISAHSEDKKYTSFSAMRELGDALREEEESVDYEDIEGEDYSDDLYDPRRTPRFWKRYLKNSLLDETASDEDEPEDEATSDEEDSEDEIALNEEDSEDEIVSDEEDSEDEIASDEEDSEDETASDEDEPEDEATSDEEDSEDEIALDEEDSEDEVALDEEDSEDEIALDEEDSEDEIVSDEEALDAEKATDDENGYGNGSTPKLNCSVYIPLKHNCPSSDDDENFGEEGFSKNDLDDGELEDEDFGGEDLGDEDLDDEDLDDEDLDDEDLDDEDLDDEDLDDEDLEDETVAEKSSVKKKNTVKDSKASGASKGKAKQKKSGAASEERTLKRVRAKNMGLKIVPYEADEKTNPSIHVYNEFVRHAYNFDEEFFSREGIDNSRLSQIYYCVIGDYPELFWLSGYEYSSEKVRLNFRCRKPTGELDIDQIIKKLREIKRGAGYFTRGITRKTDPYKALIKIYKRLILTLDYDGKGLDAGIDADMTKDDRLRSLHSAIVRRKTVCAGYASAMQYLCQSVGLPCAYVGSELVGNSGHAFNIVKIGKYCYYIDATWGDRSNTKRGDEYRDMIDFDYCCVPYDEFIMAQESTVPNHIPNSDIYPWFKKELKANRHEFYRYRKSFISRYNEDDLVRIFAYCAEHYDQKEDGRFSVSFRCTSLELAHDVMNKLRNPVTYGRIVNNAKKLLKKKKRAAKLFDRQVEFFSVDYAPVVKIFYKKER